MQLKLQTDQRGAAGDAGADSAAGAAAQPAGRVADLSTDGPVILQGTPVVTAHHTIRPQDDRAPSGTAWHGQVHVSVLQSSCCKVQDLDICGLGIEAGLSCSLSSVVAGRSGHCQVRKVVTAVQLAVVTSKESCLDAAAAQRRTKQGVLPTIVHCRCHH